MADETNQEDAAKPDAAAAAQSQQPVQVQVVDGQCCSNLCQLLSRDRFTRGIDC